MNKAQLAKWVGWGQLFIVAVGETIDQQGVPHNAHAWMHILASAAIALAVHHSSSTDGSH